MRVVSRLAIGLAALGLLAAMPVPASATFPGRVGRIAWAYRAADPNDPVSNHFGMVTFSSVGAGDHALGFCSDQEQSVSCPDWAHVSYSAGGSRLVWSIIKAGVSEIVVANANGSDQATIAPAGESNSEPSFSPNGKRLLFVRVLKGRRAQQIVTSDLSGAHERLITTTTGRNPVWSPHGRQILFVHRTTIWSVDANGHGAVPLIPNGEQPDWSPSGRQIVYVGVRSLQLYTARSDGTKRRKLPISGVCTPPACQGAVENAVYSPDNRKIAFAEQTDASGSGDPTVYTVPITGGHARPIVSIYTDNGGGGSTGLTWQALR